MMHHKKALRQTKQCANCPWKVNSDTSKIPGYDRELHQQLSGTIAELGIIEIGDTLRMMACHNSTEGDDLECVGWLHNQLGTGNNIGLRMLMFGYSNAKDIKVFGNNTPHSTTQSFR
jgi:hypothetical protein